VAGQNIPSERIRIRMEAYDHEVLDRTAHEIVDTAQRTGALVPTGKTIEALNKGLSLPPGVDIKIRVLAGSAS
jgi:small subunit ribosomal protein S10